MNKLIGYGFPFDPQHSSCSNKTPKHFHWSLPAYAEPIEKLVLIDNVIQSYTSLPQGIGNLYGWVCESRAIVPDLHKFLIWNCDVLRQFFKKIFVSDKGLVGLSSVFEYCPAGSNLPWVPESEYAIYNKTKLASMVASAKTFTKGHMIRHGYAERFKNNLDLFGGACGSPRLPDVSPGQPWKSKLLGLKDYMFHVVVENDFYDNYYTEKVTDCFATGTIPVYAGSPSIGDHFNMDGIILLNSSFDINSLTSELYYSKMDAIEDNLHRVKNLQSADDTLWGLINQ